MLLALTDDEAADAEVELDELVVLEDDEVLLSQDATVGTVTPAVEQIFWANAIVAGYH